MTKNEIKQLIHKRLFWDIDYSSLDFDKQKNFIIPRIMDRGMKKDVKLLCEYYGMETVKDVLLNARFLENKTIYYFANKFSLEPSSFRAFRLKQKNQPAWNL